MSKKSRQQGKLSPELNHVQRIEITDRKRSEECGEAETEAEAKEKVD